MPGGGSGGVDPPPRSLRSTAPPVPGMTLGPEVPAGFGLGVAARHLELGELEDEVGEDVGEEVVRPDAGLVPVVPGGGAGGVSEEDELEGVPVLPEPLPFQNGFCTLLGILSLLMLRGLS